MSETDVLVPNNDNNAFVNWGCSDQLPSLPVLSGVNIDSFLVYMKLSPVLKDFLMPTLFLFVFKSYELNKLLFISLSGIYHFACIL